MADTKTVDMIAQVLVIVGGLNWGLVGAANINVVEMLGALVAQIVYIVVGIAALYSIYATFVRK